MTTFSTAKSFADTVSKTIRRSYLIDLNKSTDERRRVRDIVTIIERLARIYVDDHIYFEYSNASYGLNIALVTGRVNQYVSHAIKGMKVRQILELVYELAQHSDNIEDYGKYLNAKYTPVLV